MPSEAFEQVVALIRAAAADDPGTSTVEEARARLDEMGALFAVPDGVEVEPAEVAGIACERYRPAAASRGLVIYHHGGSYVAGSLASHRALVARIAAAGGCEVLAVDYRLAPEHPHPAGLDDALAVYRRTLADGARPDQVIVAGDSAGGGLTTALLLALRDAGDPLPAGAVLLSPWLDLTLTADAVTSRADEDPMLTAEGLAPSAKAYGGDDLRRPLVSPVFADPAGLPPLLILVGSAEILLDDSRTFAERARAAGVEVDLDVEEGLVHVWPFIDGIPESAAALTRIAAWIDDRLA
jgi:monoterpene epsilon-lactone hydrolase